MLNERDGKDSLLISPRSVTAAATATAIFDTLGAGYATIRIALASAINTNAVGPTLSLLQSDDTVVTNFATVVANLTAVPIVSAKTVHYGIDLRGKKRYLRLTATAATATNDTITVSAIGTLSKNEDGPNGTTGVADQVVFV